LRDFRDRHERIENGLAAFHFAATAGRQKTAGALRESAVLPAEFSTRESSCFEEPRGAIVASG
jgi:hypothetical protein